MNTEFIIFLAINHIKILNVDQLATKPQKSKCVKVFSILK